MDYLLDSNVLLIYSRNDELAQRIEEKYRLLSGNHRLGISVVSVGEIEAAILKAGYGEKRIARLRNFIDALTKFGIDFEEVIRKYAQIDAYSQKKLDPSVPFTARNMGKNDLWIAATASAFDLVLLTTDQDFAHLAGTYLQLEYVSLEAYR